MIVVTVAAVAVAFVAVAAFAAVAVLPWRRLTKRHAIIGMRSGVTFDGVVLARNGPLVTLANARMFPAGGGDPIPIDGHMTLERRQIESYQTGHRDE